MNENTISYKLDRIKNATDRMRTKTGVVSGVIEDVATAVEGMSVINNQNKDITVNGTYNADEGYTGLGTINVNIPDGGYKGQLPTNAYLSARGISNNEIEVTITNTDAITEGTRIFYKEGGLPQVDSKDYIDVPVSNDKIIIKNLKSDTKYGIRGSSYVTYSEDKKALNTSNTMLSTRYALTLPNVGGITNKFTIIAPDEVVNNSYTWELEYDPYDDILYLCSNRNLLYKLNEDYTWTQITLPEDAEVTHAVATEFGLFIGSSDDSNIATKKLYKYKNGVFTNCGIPSHCLDIRRLSCGMYLFLSYIDTTNNDYPEWHSYLYDKDNDKFILMFKATNTRSYRIKVSDYGEDVYLRAYFYKWGHYNNAWYLNTTTKTTTSISHTNYVFSGNYPVVAIGDGLYIIDGYPSSTDRYTKPVILENKTQVKYMVDYSGFGMSNIFLNPFKPEDVIWINTSSDYGSSYIIDKTTGTITSEEGQWSRATDNFKSIVYDNKFFLWESDYNDSYTDYCGSYINVYDSTGFIKRIRYGEASYRPHMWIDDDGNLYRLDSYFRKYNKDTSDFTQYSGYPDSSGTKSYRLIQIENRRYFCQANSTTGPLLYIKNGVITKLGTGRYNKAIKIDDTHDLLVSTDTTVTQKIVDHVNLTITDTELPGGPQFLKDYIVDSTNHKIYKNGEVDLTLSENYTFTPVTPTNIEDNTVRNRFNNFDYMYYTDSSTNTALVYTNPYEQDNQ